MLDECKGKPLKPQKLSDNYKNSNILGNRASYAGSHHVGCRSHECDNKRSKFACNTLIVGQKRCVA